MAPPESDSDESGNDDYESEFKRPEKCDSIELYRSLIASIGGESKDKTTETHKEEALTSDDEDESEDEQQAQAGDGLTPFEKYLVKRKNKEKERKRAKKERAGVVDKKERDDDDWDVPDEIKNDPFFKEELAIRKKEKIRIATEKREEEDKALAQMEREKEEREVNIDGLST